MSKETLQDNRAFSRLKHRPLLAIMSFSEAAFLPIPSCLVLLTLCFSHPKKSANYGVCALLFSSIGSVYGYTIGHFGVALFGVGFSEFVLSDCYLNMVGLSEPYGLGEIFLAALLPFPFLFVTLSAGFNGVGVIPFLVFSTAGRAVHFYLCTSVIFLYLKWRSRTMVNCKKVRDE